MFSKHYWFNVVSRGFPSSQDGVSPLGCISFLITMKKSGQNTKNNYARTLNSKYKQAGCGRKSNLEKQFLSGKIPNIFLSSLSHISPEYEPQSQRMQIDKTPKEPNLSGQRPGKGVLEDRRGKSWKGES